MGYRPISFAPGEIYHVFHRGLNQQDIFHDDKDRNRFLNLLMYCNWPEHKLSYSVREKLKKNSKHWPTMPPSGKGFTDVLCYCLMNNHIHLLLKENKVRGISTLLQRMFNGFAKYFNTRYQRTGGLFTGRFRAVHINGDEQFLHVSRYIHLNPFTAHLVNDIYKYPWSSLSEYTYKNKKNICHIKLLSGISNRSDYRLFISDYADYARGLADIKHLTFDDI